MPKALMLEPKHFAVHDGPGIRTTFFFKGCSLRCLWCHNPESISPNKEMGYYSHKCITCGECREVCPHNAHLLNDKGHSFIRENCLLCGKCEKECLGEALTLYGKEVTLEEAMKEALQDLDFYKESNGGVTLSGGEPLLQADFAAAFLEELKKVSIHTALDSCANVPWGAFKKLLPFVDLFLIDFKHASSEEHRKLTGAGNERICENLRRLAAEKLPIEIRIPFVPSCNSSRENMEATGRFLQEIAPQKVVLLPYHDLAGGKYTAIGQEYKLTHIPLPEEGALEEALAILNKYVPAGLE